MTPTQAELSSHLPRQILKILFGAYNRFGNAGQFGLLNTAYRFVLGWEHMTDDECAEIGQ
jgi:hypothetical protein